ncbi:unnamed protein product, partial [Mesorhabditis belari]|uniref:Transporter n=1 Tax=Mesorhabditis belari TaxID=2138241 RepID=A0AAF3EAU8_9BILA
MSLSSQGDSGIIKKSSKSLRTDKQSFDESLYPPFVKQLDAKLPDYSREGDIEYPFEETGGIGDENRVRGNWTTKADYLLSVVGFVFGLGNVWRFPFLVFTYGGLAFLVPYFVALTIAAMPMMFMETVLGQFSSLSATAVWKVVPLFKGVGLTMIFVCVLIAIYLNIVSAWSLFYLFNSISFSIPWSNCANSWSGLNCTYGSRSVCIELNGTILVNGTCLLNIDNETRTIMVKDGNEIPSLKYFHEEVLMLSNGFDSFGTLNWYLGICVLISWICVFLCLFQGVKSSGKVVYIFVLLPYIIMCVLFARLLTLAGSLEAVWHFLRPDWSILTQLPVWGEAAVQVFYSVSCCTGGLITLSSYNRFHNNLFKDIWIIVFVDLFSSLCACVLTFSALGFTCYQFSIKLDQIQIADGAHLVFVFLAEALAGVPVAPLYCGLFFLMMCLVILSTQLFVVETIVTSICDEFPERLRRNRRHVLTTTCACFILLSIPFCTSPGMYWLVLIDHFVITWPLVVIAFLECMAISWIYGIDNLLDNIKWITNFYPPFYMFWKILWKFVCPMVYLCILCFVWLEWRPLRYGSYEFPYWTLLLGWGISILPVTAIPITACVQLCTVKGSLVQKWRAVLNPHDSWGPALAVHRAEQFPLQIPEARRLLLPPELEVNAKVYEKQEESPQSRRDSRAPQIPRSQAPSTRSIAATRNSLPSFERETAI